MFRTLLTSSRVKALLVGVLALGLTAAVGVWSAAGEGEPTTGPETGLRSVEGELSVMRANGMAEDDPVIQTLVAERALLLELAKAPPPPPPDPEVVASILNTPPSPASYDSGEVPCEGGLGTPNVDWTSPVRCFVVPRADGTALEIWLTQRGRAFVMHGSWSGAIKPETAEFSIPLIANLDSVKIVLDGEVLRIKGAGPEVAIGTDGWFAGETR